MSAFLPSTASNNRLASKAVATPATTNPHVPDPPKLDAYHGDKDPGFGAGFGIFVVTNQPAVAHEPAEGSLDHPAVGQLFEAADVIGAFDDLDHQLGAEFFDPLRKGIAGVATIHPQKAQRGEPGQHLAQNRLRPVPFRCAGWSHRHPEHQPQSINQQMPLAAFDPLGVDITNASPMTIGLHTLAIQNRRRRLRSFVVGFPDEDAQRVGEGRPLVVKSPFSEDMVNGFPRWKVHGQIAPRDAALNDIEDGIQDAPSVGGRTSALGKLGEHGKKIVPLSVSKACVVYSVFHALTEAALNI